jgi:KDO2-lipid IV(A) lauroyltransferase
VKFLRYQIEALAFRVLLAAARLLPRRPLLALGGLVGRVAYAVDRRHRRVTHDNLRLAYGDGLPAERLRQIAVGCWIHFGRSIVDALCFPRFGPDAIGTVVHYEGLEHIRAAYAKGRGVLLFSGHFGNWELTAFMQGYLELPLVLITRRLDNPALERLLADVRQSTGNRVVHKRDAVREIVRALRDKLGVAIVIDQDARGSGVFVPFFGHLASTTPTLARIALRTGAAVVPTFSVPQPDGTYIVTYEAEVQVVETGDRDEDARRLTAECTAILERWVRRYPDQWLWMHRRWKTRPPLSASGEA